MHQGRLAALAGAEGDPWGLVEVIEGVDEPVVIPRGLLHGQKIPVQRSGHGLPEVAVLHHHLVRLQQLGRLAQVALVAGKIVALHHEHNGPVLGLVSQPGPLREGAAGGVGVIDRLLQ